VEVAGGRRGAQLASTPSSIEQTRPDDGESMQSCKVQRPLACRHSLACTWSVHIISGRAADPEHETIEHETGEHESSSACSCLFHRLVALSHSSTRTALVPAHKRRTATHSLCTAIRSSSSQTSQSRRHVHRCKRGLCLAPLDPRLISALDLISALRPRYR
jgi:hypothetical protein